MHGPLHNLCWVFFNKKSTSETKGAKVGCFLFLKMERPDPKGHVKYCITWRTWSARAMLLSVVH